MTDPKKEADPQGGEPSSNEGTQDEFEVENPCDSDDEYRLESIPSHDESASDDQCPQRDQLALRPSFDDLATEQEPVRFTLLELLLLTAFAAGILAVYPHVSPPAFAFVLGVSAFVSLIVISLFSTQRSIIIIGWWLLLAVYLVVAIAASLRN